MEPDPLIQKYIAIRDNFVLRIAKISAELNAWTDRHAKTPPSLRDIANFEGLRAERSRLLSEFTEVEDQFVLQLLQRLSSEENGEQGS